MSDFDYKTALKDLYLPSVKKDIHFVEVPPLNFLMMDGHGDPNTAPIYAETVSTLYAVAYTIKFAAKKKGFDFGVPPLEGLWWVENMTEFSIEHKDNWDWTMMIMLPNAVTADLVAQGCQEAARKKALPLLPNLRFGPYAEGLSVQVMYTGAYADEGPTIARMHALAVEQGFEIHGKHHEIYLGDPRRTAPEKLKTVIRQPVKRRG